MVQHAYWGQPLLKPTTGSRRISRPILDNEKTCVYRGGGWVENSWRMDWTVMHRGNFFSKYIKDGKSH